MCFLKLNYAIISVCAALLFINPVTAESAECDTSSPSKFFISLAECPENMKDEEIFSTFYELRSIDALIDYENGASNGSAIFRQFSDNLTSHFGERLLEKKPGLVKITLSEKDSSGGRFFVTWKYSVSSLTSQIRLLGKDDITIHSGDIEADIISVDVTIKGERKKITLVKTGNGYRISLEPSEIEKMKILAARIHRVNDLLGLYNFSMENGLINNENFESTMIEWKKEFDEAVKSGK